MKPYVICHMGMSVDGRIIPGHWSHVGEIRAALTEDYERLQEEFAAEAWLVGRITMAEIAKGEAKPDLPAAGIDRGNFIAMRDAKGYAIAIDAGGKLHFQSDTIYGNHAVAVLSEAVPTSHLAELRAAGVSYVFAGRNDVDLKLALETLNRELGITKLMLEGGGTINGAFLRAGLIDELSVLVAPAVDGLRGMPALFDYDGAPDETPPLSGLKLSLINATVRGHGIVWLRYRVGAAQ